MYRFLIIIIYILISIFAGCSFKYDNHSILADSINQKPKIEKTKKDLSEIEEVYKNFDYTSVINQYSPQLGNDISITKFQYFVIFSDLSPELTYDLIDTDIRYTVEAMLKTYAREKPKKVIPVILFEDYNTYKDFSVNTLGIEENDLSPYGFYKISKNAVVIRYVSWKGSLPHELTHALVQNDFPDMPSWFNEGLASLHEKSVFKNGELFGDFSWRIISIRRAVSENTYTGLNVLMNTNDDEFYSKKSSFYYAQARYLLMYMQQKDLLKKYYQTFKDSYEKDNSGITQLEKVTGKTIDELDKELLDYVNSFKE